MPLNLDKEIIKSPLNFTGGKYKLLPQLLPLFPKDVSTFIDLFCGGCNVGINAIAENIICNDIDSNLIGLFSFFKEKTYEDLYPNIQEILTNYNLSDSEKNGYSYYNCSSAAGLGNYNRKGFLDLRTTFNSLTKTDETYFLYLYILIVYSFNNQIRFNSAGKFNLPVGKRDFKIRMQNKLKKFISIIKEKNITFSNQYFSNIKIENLDKNAFIYADPPYLITCATYNEKSWNENEEKNLLAYLDELEKNGIRFALSNVLSTDNKKNTILHEWLNNRKYNCHHLNFSYKNSNYHKKNISKTDEVLITNY